MILAMKNVLKHNFLYKRNRWNLSILLVVCASGYDDLAPLLSALIIYSYTLILKREQNHFLICFGICVAVFMPTGFC